jgi:membrane-associated protein
MEYLLGIIDFIVHIDKHLDQLIVAYGSWTYLILFLIVFCETGLVITPFLPGDSLLFAVGAFASRGSFSLPSVSLVIFVAAVIGDAVNYKIGSYLGESVFQEKYRRIFKPEYLHKTQAFFDRYGGKAIIFARFVPIVRTFAPFMAGVGKMNYSRFAFYNVSGAALWVVLLVGAGFAFGEMPFVKKNFSLVILAVIIISILPAVFEVIAAKRRARREAAQA